MSDARVGHGTGAQETTANGLVDLPVPTLTGLEIKESVPTIVPQEIPASTMNISEADPWASPEMHRGHDHARSVNSTQGVKSTASNVSSIGRTTSGFTTAGLEESKSSLVQETSARETSTSNAAGEVWGSFGGISPEPPVDILQDVSSRHAATIKTGTDRSTMENPTRNNARSTNNTTETITVTLLPEKEGIFMFQHHNYQVTSIRRGSQVVRRYSDFVWLLDCLHKRYPFRQLPLLPPKRVAGEYSRPDPTQCSSIF